MSLPHFFILFCGRLRNSGLVNEDNLDLKKSTLLNVRTRSCPIHNDQFNVI